LVCMGVHDGCCCCARLHACTQSAHGAAGAWAARCARVPTRACDDVRAEGHARAQRRPRPRDERVVRLPAVAAPHAREHAGRPRLRWHVQGVAHVWAGRDDLWPDARGAGGGGRGGGGGGWGGGGGGGGARGGGGGGPPATHHKAGHVVGGCRRHTWRTHWHCPHRGSRRNSTARGATRHHQHAPPARCQ
jgi:hypothetical protein